jgi:hypothetical protein
MPAEPVAAARTDAHTRSMGVFLNRRFVTAAIGAISLATAAAPVSADEIRLKDGKKLYGVIVSYEENMFKVKTDFGYVLVEKDKIASIIPTAPASSEAQSTAAQPTAKGSAEPTKGRPGVQAKPETAIASVTDPIPSTTNASVKVATPGAGKQSTIDKTGGKISGLPIKPEPPGTAPVPDPAAPALKGSSAAANSTLPAAAALPAQPKEPEVPAIREDVQGNLYTNYTHGFRMYKAPSWQLIDDARNALPNAIVAMGTSNESSLMVVGREKTKEPLDSAAVAVERRLHDVYENYQRASQRKTVVGGSPAVEFHYRGNADGHDWSGTLVVISRSGDIFTVLGMTYADSDLIQIQENVIAKAIGSLNFDVPEAKK